MQIDLGYYRTVAATQHKAEILRAELTDLIAEVESDLLKIIALCGNPDAAEACRNVICVCKEIIEKNEPAPPEEEG